MPQTYRKLHHWDTWLAQHEFGQVLLGVESESISTLTKQHFGKHVVLIGSPYQQVLLNSVSLPCRTMMTPLMVQDKQEELIETGLHELPIMTGSVDLVIVPHTLEFIDNPRQLLAEACRIVKPEGLILIMGLNPYSLLGMRQFLLNKKLPWKHHRINAYQVKNWLRLADFRIEAHQTALFFPALRSPSLYQKFHFMETMGQYCLPKMGGIYIVMARAKVVPLTPIKMKWKQQLSGLRLPNSIPGHIVRHQK